MGHDNLASGFQALFANTSGTFNVAAGTSALQANTTGVNNGASGVNALRANTTGHDNLAEGTNALLSSTTASNNVAVGSSALRSDTTGATNFAGGVNALRANTTASNGVAVGTGALGSNTTGANNTSSGYQALNKNTTGVNNTALGFQAGINQSTGSNNVYVADKGTAGESGSIRIGTTGTQTAAFVAGVNGVSIAGPTQPVLVNAAGQLGTATSSSRALKTDIHGLGGTAQRVLALRPVSYRYKAAPLVGGATEPQYGLIAEQVARQFPDPRPARNRRQARWHLLPAAPRPHARPGPTPTAADPRPGSPHPPTNRGRSTGSSATHTTTDPRCDPTQGARSPTPSMRTRTEGTLRGFDGNRGSVNECTAPPVPAKWGKVVPSRRACDRASARDGSLA